MKNKREIVAENLAALRKANNLTQIELSKKVNYSDKAISRWEKGEVEPDFDTLESLAKIYHVSFEYLFQEHNDGIEITKSQRRFSNSTIVFALVELLVWTLITIIYVYQSIRGGFNDWTVWILGASISLFILAFANIFLFKSKIVYFIANSLLIWSITTYVFCINLPSNLWLIYIIGIPVQAIVIVVYFLIYDK